MSKVHSLRKVLEDEQDPPNTDSSPTVEAAFKEGDIKDVDWDGPNRIVILACKDGNALIARLGDWSETNQLKCTEQELKEMLR